MYKKLKMDKEQALDFLKRIEVVVKTMREKEEGMFKTYNPYELKGTKGITDKVVFPPEGGTLLYFKDGHYLKGVPFAESVRAVDEVKKALMVLVRGFGGFKSKLKLLFFGLLFKKEIIKSFVELLEALNRKIEGFRLKPDKYCNTAREIYRTFQEVIYFENDDKFKKVLIDVRDLACMILEYDDSYRYRFQNIIVGLNQGELKKNIVKELNRLFEIAIKKEKFISAPEDRTNVANKLKSLQKIVLVLRFSRKPRKILIKFLRTLNLEEFVMDKEDLYYSSPKGFEQC